MKTLFFDGQPIELPDRPVNLGQAADTVDAKDRTVGSSK
jgi:hypothetical protein